MRMLSLQCVTLVASRGSLCPSYDGQGAVRDVSAPSREPWQGHASTARGRAAEAWMQSGDCRKRGLSEGETFKAFKNPPSRPPSSSTRLTVLSAQQVRSGGSVAEVDRRAPECSRLRRRGVQSCQYCPQITRAILYYHGSRPLVIGIHFLLQNHDGRTVQKLFFHLI